MTPPDLATRIVAHFKPSGRLLDPCRGTSQSFYRAMVALPGCTVDWCELTEGRDFFDHHDPCQWVCTNPPWSKILPFLRHAMVLADNVVFLASLQAMTLRARLAAINAAGFGIREALLLDHPPAPWPASGFQLAAVHVQRGFVGPLSMLRLS